MRPWISFGSYMNMETIDLMPRWDCRSNINCPIYFSNILETWMHKIWVVSTSSSNDSYIAIYRTSNFLRACICWQFETFTNLSMLNILLWNHRSWSYCIKTCTKYRSSNDWTNKFLFICGCRFDFEWKCFILIHRWFYRKGITRLSLTIIY